MTTPTPSPYVGQFVVMKRSAIVFVAIAAIVIGVIALVWPAVTLGLVGFLFGIFLIISGVQRIAAAVADRATLGSWFALNLIAGIIVLVAGILCFFNPTNSIVFLGVVVGVGWVISGAVDLAVASRSPKGSRTLLIVSGVLALLAGIAAILAPILAASVFLTIAAILLIVVGISVLMTYPRTSAAA
jgi:uncharacterized membrane protein HdeD (DUF308 family)